MWHVFGREELKTGFRLGTIHKREMWNMWTEMGEMVEVGLDCNILARSRDPWR